MRQNFTKTNQRGKERSSDIQKEGRSTAGKEFQKGKKRAGTGQEKHRLTDNQKERSSKKNKEAVGREEQYEGKDRENVQTDRTRK